MRHITILEHGQVNRKIFDSKKFTRSIESNASAGIFAVVQLANNLYKTFRTPTNYFSDDQLSGRSSASNAAPITTSSSTITSDQYICHLSPSFAQLILCFFERSLHFILYCALYFKVCVTIQPPSPCAIITLPLYYPSTPNVTHMISHTRPSRFSAYNIKKLRMSLWTRLHSITFVCTPVKPLPPTPTITTRILIGKMLLLFNSYYYSNIP